MECIVALKAAPGSTPAAPADGPGVQEKRELIFFLGAVHNMLTSCVKN